MDDLETGKDKIKKICDILKNETLEPAKVEAEKIIEEAKSQAHSIIKTAEAKAAQILKDATEKNEKEKKLFQNSLVGAWKQAIETLRQDIETKLFNDELKSWVDAQTQDPKVGSKLIAAIVEAIEKEGTSADFSAYIAKSVSPEKINALLAKNILSKLKEKSVVVGNMDGGVQLKLHDHKLTLDLSDEAIKELLSRYIRKDFRFLLFNA